MEFRALLMLFLMQFLCGRSLLLDEIHRTLNDLSHSLNEQISILKNDQTTNQKYNDLKFQVNQLDSFVKVQAAEVSNMLRVFEEKIKQDIKGQLQIFEDHIALKKPNSNFQEQIDAHKTDIDKKISSLDAALRDVASEVTAVGILLEESHDNLYLMVGQLVNNTGTCKCSDATQQILISDPVVQTSVSEFPVQSQVPSSMYAVQSQEPSNSYPVEGATCFEDEIFVCLKYFRDYKTWSDANKDCGRDGGYLVVINNAKFNLEVQRLVSKEDQFNYPWIGLKQISRWNYRWITGEEINMDPNNVYTVGYKNFAYPEEYDNDDHRGEDDHACIDMYGYTGKWNDWDCNAALPYVCEYRPV